MNDAAKLLVAELASTRDPRAAPLFAYLVRHVNRSRHAQVYLSAIEALGALGAAEGARGSDLDPLIDALAAALQRGEWWAPMRTRRTRLAAAAALKRVGTAAIEALEGAARRGARGTRAAARVHLTGSR